MYCCNYVINSQQVVSLSSILVATQPEVPARLTAHTSIVGSRSVKMTKLE